MDSYRRCFGCKSRKTGRDLRLAAWHQTFAPSCSHAATLQLHTSHARMHACMVTVKVTRPPPHTNTHHTPRASHIAHHTSHNVTHGASHISHRTSHTRGLQAAGTGTAKEFLQALLRALVLLMTAADASHAGHATSMFPCMAVQVRVRRQVGTGLDKQVDFSHLAMSNEPTLARHWPAIWRD